MIIIVSHDAGGAEILSSWVKHNYSNYQDVLFLLEGPAIHIFKRKVNIESVITREDFLHLNIHPQFVITGTSWQSDLEKFAIKICLKIKIKVITFLDHWVNYQERFNHLNKILLPNEIWVGDSKAESIAKIYFPENIIKIVDNPYFIDIQNEFYNLSQFNKNKIRKFKRILYCSEPIADHTSKNSNNKSLLGYDEYSALSYFLTWFSKKYHFSLSYIKIVIRYHPSDKMNKYDQILSNYSQLNIKFSNNNMLVQDIFQSDIIIGCESMALVIGVLVNKPVYCCIPPSGRKCLLPFKEIKPLYLSEIF